MFQIEEIAILVNEIVESFKKGNSTKKPPEFNPIYLKCLDYESKIAAHSDPDEIPLSLINRKARKEKKEEKDARFDTWEPITYPAWDRAESMMNRIFTDSNYSIVFPEKKVTDILDIQKYLFTDYPTYGSIMKYAQSVLSNKKIRDPNAVVAITPKESIFKVNDEGERVVDQEKQIEPIAVVYDCSQIIRFKEESHAVIWLKEKSIVTVGDRKVRKGHIMLFFDKGNIWEIRQKGEKSEWDFGISLVIAHDMGFLPVWKLKGKPKMIDSHTIYKSIFLPAVPKLNNALWDASTLELIKQQHAHPKYWEVVEKCKSAGCVSGRKLKDGDQINCSECSGTGEMGGGSSTFTSKKIFLPDKFDGEKDVPNIPMGYVSPPPAMLEFTRKEIDTAIVDAFCALNMDVSNSNVKGSDTTALGKVIDREEFFSFLLNFSSETFGLIDQIIMGIGFMINEKFEPPVVNEPKTFAIRTEDELTQEFVDAKKGDIPDVALRQIWREWIGKRFGTDIKGKKIINLIEKSDRLLTLNQKEIGIQLTTDQASSWEGILHTSVMTWIDQEIEKDSKYLDKKLEDQIKILVDRAKKEAKEIKDGNKEVNEDFAA